MDNTEETDNNIVINIERNEDNNREEHIVRNINSQEDREQYYLNEPLTNSSVSSNTKRTYSLEDTLKKMRKYRWLHKTASEHYDKMNSIIIGPTILLSAVTTVLSVASINPIVLAAIAGLSTTLLGLSTYLKLNSKQTSHLISAEGFDNLVTMIDFEIKFPDQDIKTFAGNIETKILEIKKSSHFLPPEFIYNQYLKKKNIIEGN